ncbi:uncharacterized protein Nmag_0970 [Natrialba magadii ATCC 43099]|uniref:Uncharacterized protein n=1 Tax=Natrialba magadii (strain ATCC 43099 / DSM 3394 / CCM 3739 / CIP 104546 / IAM 13178 / JCM 8861 / NBRC 102185 / NCIMB 2190 / MS3) TaxID=547559 RepID=D3SQR6_NATMM|nr:hypothetical protein [Natrialba magadii]ADD04554.1 uncharacterized protein Nmag_0970 [Natrialba magadii ATCC 43099]ELY25211.1 hypothetical protein C500_17376 [Natrialba magadii ATCC 43099]
MSNSTSSWQRRTVLAALSSVGTVGVASGVASAGSGRGTEKSGEDNNRPSEQKRTIDLDKDEPTVDRQQALARSAIAPDATLSNPSPPDGDLTYVAGWEDDWQSELGCTFASDGTVEYDHHCYVWMLDEGTGDPPTDGDGNYRYVIELYASAQRLEDSGLGCSGPYVDHLMSHVECNPDSASADLEFHDRNPDSIHSYNSQPVTLSMSGEYGDVGFGFSWTQSWHEGYYGQDEYSPGVGGEYAVYWKNDDGDPEDEGVQGFVEISFPYEIDFDGWPYTGLSWTPDGTSFTSGDPR